MDQNVVAVASGVAAALRDQTEVARPDTHLAFSAMQLRRRIRPHSACAPTTLATMMIFARHRLPPPLLLSPDFLTLARRMSDRELTESP